MDISILLILSMSVLCLSFVQANPQDKGPQTFEASQPQYAQRYKEVIMYLTPTQIRNYEAGHGLPNINNEQQAIPQAQYEQEKSPQYPVSYTYVQEQIPQPSPAFIYAQQKQVKETPINEEEGQIIQSTLDILEANKMQFQLAQQNYPELEITRAEEDLNSEIRPIVEPSAEYEERTRNQLLQRQQEQQQQQQQQEKQQEQQQQEQNKLIEQANQQQEQIAKSYAYIHFFSNQKPESPEKIQIFHPEPHSVNLDEEIKLQKENKIEIQQDPLLHKKFKLIPYEYIAEQNVQQKTTIRDDLIKTGQKQVQQQLFMPAEDQWRPIIPQKEYQQQYAPKFTSPTNNIDLGKIIQEIQLEREAAKIHAENIAKSPPIVIHKDITLVKRRPVHVIKHVNIPYPAPFFVPFTKQVEIKVPQPYAVPVEIIRHVPVPIVKTEAVEVEKPVPYEVEKHVPEIVEKKVYVPVEKPYTVERIVPVEVKKEIPVPVPVHKPEKLTIIRHVWKH